MTKNQELRGQERENRRATKHQILTTNVQFLNRRTLQMYKTNQERQIH
uniref:Uncharacterized protein n=1 Tax=Arundo donax TaxID=35708 RepID=A0A0A9B8T5_ARUDO